MKKGILILLLASSVCTQAQTLKETLFGGKLKNQPGTVIRKGDDLSTKIDTTSKVAPNDSATAKKPAPALTDSAKTSIAQTGAADSANVGNATVNNEADTTTLSTADNALKETTAAPKDNNAVWKAYVETVITGLKTEALPNKKIKRGTYYATVSYSIGTDGQVEVSDVILTPENGFLQQQIKDRLSIDTPRLTPVTNSAGTPRKVTRKYNFTLVKE